MKTNLVGVAYYKKTTFKKFYLLEFARFKNYTFSSNIKLMSTLMNFKQKKLQDNVSFIYSNKNDNKFIAWN